MTTLNYISQIDLLVTGWKLFDLDNQDDALLSLAKGFGRILPDDNGNFIQYLKPKAEGQGLRGSFSYNLGFNEFPYHTDTAFWERPAQLILMSSEKSSCCHTILIDTKPLLKTLTTNEKSTFFNAVFTLKTNQGIKFVSVLDDKDGKYQFRYDPNIMMPFNSSAKKISGVMTEFINGAKPIEIKWTGNNVLILDNWRFLHKRSECKTELNRLLKRIYIQ